MASTPLRLGADAAPGYVPLQDYDAPPSSAGGTDYAEIEGDYTGYDAIAMAMLGEWRSTDDPRAGLDVEFGQDGLVGAFTHDGKPGAPMALAFAEGCDGRSVSELDMVMFVLDSGKGETPLCYTLNRITPDDLMMTYLPRGNTLRYRRR